MQAWVKLPLVQILVVVANIQEKWKDILPQGNPFLTQNIV